MKNWKFTVFYIKENNPQRMEELRVDTYDEWKYQKAMEYAKIHNIKITRVYTPTTEIKKPDFTKVF